MSESQTTLRRLKRCCLARAMAGGLRLKPEGVLPRRSRRRLILVLAFAGCKTVAPDPSQPLLIHGRPESGYPAVRMISIRTDHGGPDLCTGSFVSDTVMITAAHCLLGREKTGWSVDGIEPSGVLPNRVYAGFSSVDYDIGLLVFPEGTGARLGIRPEDRLRLAPGRPKVGDIVTQVGFGRDDYVKRTGEGVKRSGVNTVANVDSLTLEIHTVTTCSLHDPAAGTGAGGYGGDSGGPLLNQRGELIGVFSAYDLCFEEGQRRVSAFASPVSESSREFFDGVFACAEGAPCAPAFAIPPR